MTDLDTPSLASIGRVCGLKFRRVVDRADADDDALPGHESGHRLDRPDCAGIGEARRRPREVVRADLLVARLADEVLVRQPERAEVEGVGVLDHGDEQGVGSVGLLDVDGEAETDVGVVDHRGLAVELGVGGIHDRHFAQGLHHRVPDEVGEADLPPVSTAQVVVEDPAVDLEQLGRYDPDAGCGRHLPRCGHVAGDHRCRPLQDLCLL